MIVVMEQRRRSCQLGLSPATKTKITPRARGDTEVTRRGLLEKATAKAKATESRRKIQNLTTDLTDLHRSVGEFLIFEF